MAASTIAAFIALVAVSTLKAVSVGAETVERDMETADELRFALNMVQRDLSNFYRDGNFQHSKLVGSIEPAGEDLCSMITFYTVGRAKARPDEPECDIYEVEYFLLRSEEKSSLARRLWPNPDNLLPVGTAQRGVLTLIADNIELFQVRYFDGDEWQIDWPEELTELPELIEVTIAAASEDSKTPTIASFMVNFVRAAGERDSLDEQTEETVNQTQQATQTGAGNN